MARRLLWIPLLCLGLVFVFAGPALADPIPGDTSLQGTDSTDQNAYLKLSQGQDIYESISFDQWYASLPECTGHLSSEQCDVAALKKRDFGKHASAIGQAVASIKKAELSKSTDPAFQLWATAHLTKPIEILNLDRTTYGYAYGVVHGKKLIGYLVAGASRKAPPILEYSLDVGKYLKLMAASRVYFGRATGFLLAQDDTVRDLARNHAFGTESSLSTLVAANEPTPDAQAALDRAWEEAQQDAGSSVSALTADPAGTYAPIDTCDFTYMHPAGCASVAMAMYVDALARRIEPGLFLWGRPHSKTIDDYFWNHMPSGGYHSDDIQATLSTYLNSYDLSPYLYFTLRLIDSGNGSGATNAQVLAQEKSVVNSGWPTVIGYAAGGSAHAMMAVGYTGNYYICRDTYTEDKTPFDTYYYNSAGYTWWCVWSTWTNSSPSTAWGTPVLRLGDSGFNVKRLQYFLNELYYSPGTIDGVFGTSTENAVKAFQSDNGLTADGIVGSGTYAKLKVSHIMKYDSRTGSWRVLSEGKKGDDVAQLQFRLIRRGYLPGLPDNWSVVDGVFGPQTKSAVMAFQSAQGITADGIAGSTTMQRFAYY